MSKQLKSIIAQFRQVRDDGVKLKVDIIDSKSSLIWLGARKILLPSLTLRVLLRIMT